MIDPIVSQDLVGKQAKAAAIKAALHGVEPVNPYPACSAAYDLWRRLFEVNLLFFSPLTAQAEV